MLFLWLRIPHSPSTPGLMSNEVLIMLSSLVTVTSHVDIQLWHIWHFH